MLNDEIIEKLNKLREKSMLKITAEEIELRKTASQQALANVKLEGLAVSSAHLSDVDDFNHGRITMDEVLKRIKER